VTVPANRVLHVLPDRVVRTGGPLGAFALVLAAGAAWALSNVATHRAAPPDMLPFMVWVSAVAAPLDSALSLVIEGPARDLAALRNLTLVGVASIGYVTLVATLFGYGARGALLRRYGTSAVAPFAMLAPVFAIAAGALMLAEPVRGTDILGGALVLAGIGFTLTRPQPAPPRRIGGTRQPDGHFQPAANDLVRRADLPGRVGGKRASR
jgi:O-acetylserine/cysteine efflux transporter